MPLLQINVANKVATYLKKGGTVVCGNSDYVIEFAFDSEWDAHTEKTARFIWKSKYLDVAFSGTACPMPAVHRTEAVKVGVYAGNLYTTTSAVIPCQRSILCGTNVPQEGNEEHYASEAQKAAMAAQEAAEAATRAAQEAADDAVEAVEAYAEQAAEEVVKEMMTGQVNNAFACALKGVASGGAVRLDDVSPFEHSMKVRVEEGGEGIDVSTVKVGVMGKNLAKNTAQSKTASGIKMTVNEDGSLYFVGTATAFVSFDPIVTAANLLPFLKDGVSYVVPDGFYFYCKDENGGAKYATKTIVWSAAYTSPRLYIQFDAGKSVDRVYYPQLEIGKAAADRSAYEPYQEPQWYTVNADGTVDGIIGAGKTMTLLTDTEGTTVAVEYNRDTTKALAEIYEAINALGGSI